MRAQTLSIALSLSAAIGLAAAAPAQAQFYEQRNLVSDGAIPAEQPADSNLVNAWGLVAGPTTPWWVANNGSGTSTLYNGNTGAKQALTVTVPGAPTGIVSNIPFTSFGGARFIFASEDGTISSWSGGTLAAVAAATPGAIYKGLAIAHTNAGDVLYATNFHAGTVDVFDSSFQPVANPGFVDPDIPSGYAPFGIQNLGGTIYVTYALQDADKEDDVPGEGHGYIDAFDTAGNLLHRVASKGTLNSPWGLAFAPDGFGKFSGDLLVGNFGNGRIHAYRPRLTGRDEFQRHGQLHSIHGKPIEIPGLWALQFGNGAAAGPTATLFFTAGPNDEQDGLFGAITAAEPPGRNR
jgi:uncharacterized protein (TIGR03118 family)